MQKRISIMIMLTLAIVLMACSTNDDLPLPEPTTPPDILTEEGSGEINGYTLVWEDLFNEPVLNTDNWQIEENGDGGGNQELQYYRKENVAIGKEQETGKNCLIITAKKESYNGKSATSGRLNTHTKHAFTFGKIEASIKLPKTANGLWPAFWMLGDDYQTNPWPVCGEIDILEMGHTDGITQNRTETFFNGACHWGHYVGTGHPNYAKMKNADYSLQENFHLYTLIWDENNIKMYLDLDKYPNTEPYFDMAIHDRSTDSSPGKYLQKDFFIILNMAVGGNFTSIWDINKVTALDSGDAKMYVDFVKVYQKQ